MAASALRVAAAHDRLCVRKPGADRAALRRAGAGDPAGDGVNSACHCDERNAGISYDPDTCTMCCEAYKAI